MNSAIEVLSCPSMAPAFKCRKWKQTYSVTERSNQNRATYQHIKAMQSGYMGHTHANSKYPSYHIWHDPSVTDEFQGLNSPQTRTCRPNIFSHQWPAHSRSLIYQTRLDYKSSFPHTWPPWPRRGPQTSTINLDRMPQCPLQSRFCSGIIHKVCNTFQCAYNKRNALKL